MRLFLRLAVLTSLLPPMAAIADIGSALVASAAKANAPTVAWDDKSIVRGDFNGDGRQDAAIIGTHQRKIFVAVVIATSSKKPKTQVLEFGIGTRSTDSICEVPARLEVEPLECSPLDGPLPGCRPSPKAVSLVLYGGECDPINFYWHHAKNIMRWWRV